MNPVSEKPISHRTLIDKAASFIREQWEQSAPPEFLFHGVESTESWIDLATDIAKESNLPSSDLELIELALWFRSYGFLLQKKDWGQQLAQDYLAEQGAPAGTIEQVKRLIQSTLEEETPTDLTEEVLHDTLWAFLGKKKFLDHAALLRIEREYLNEKPFTELEWKKFLQDLQFRHPFHTAFAEEKYGKRRRKNIAKLRSGLVKAKTDAVKKKTGKNFGRGIDTLYRVNFRNHINLSSIADGKANTMISINTILLSIIITLSSAGYAFIDQISNQSLATTLPVLLLLLTCVVSLIFAVLSTRPKVTSKNVENESEPKDHKPNLLFFGNFLKVSQNEFVDYLGYLKVNQEQLYDDMSKDLYNLGKVIKHKYDLLTVSYNCFLVGIVLTVLTFIIMQIIGI